MGLLLGVSHAHADAIPSGTMGWSGNGLVFGQGDFTSRPAVGDPTTHKIDRMAIDLKWGYYLISNLAIGVGIGLDETTTQSTTGAATTKVISDEQKFGGFVRYHLPLTEALHLVTNIGFNTVKDLQKVDTTSNAKNGTEMDFRVGLAQFIKPGMSVDYTIGYGMTDMQYTDGGPEYSGGGIDLGIGFSWYTNM